MFRCGRHSLDSNNAKYKKNSPAVLVVQQIKKLSPSPKGLLKVHNIEHRHEAIWRARRRQHLFIIMMSDYEQ